MKYLILLLIFFIISCNKEDECEFDKLTGDQQQLIGEWEWQYSVLYKFNVASGQLIEIDTMNQENSGRSHKIIIDENNFIQMKTNSSYFDLGNFYIQEWMENYTTDFYDKVIMNLDFCNSGNTHIFYIKGDTLLSESFPYPDAFYNTSVDRTYSYYATFTRK